MDQLKKIDEGVPSSGSVGAIDRVTIVPDGLNSFIGSNEIPRELPLWRDCLFDNQNPALAIRWAAAMAEIEKTLEIDEEVRNSAVREWRSEVVSIVNTHENLSYFEEASDTDSIISLRVKHPETGEWMNKTELSKVFKAMT